MLSDKQILMENRDMFLVENYINKDLIEVNYKESNLSLHVFKDITIDRSIFHKVNLEHSIFINCIINNCSFRDTNLESSKFNNCTFINTSFAFANMSSIKIYDTHFKNCFFGNANLYGSIISHNNFLFCNFTGANIANSQIVKNIMDYCVYLNTYFILQCPSEGSFIGFKKLKNNRIAKILILEDSLRSSATTRKCRASKVKVLSISNIENTINYMQGFSTYDPDFKYEVNDIIEITNFDKDRWNECSTGIHFFITREEAIHYLTI